MKDLLKKLVETPCTPQFQDRLIDLLEKEIDFAEIETDHLGNVHLVAESGGAEKIVFLSRLNELGFTVEHIDDSGFLRFGKISDVDERTLLGQRMMIHGKNGDVRGVVGAKPPHLLKSEEEAKKQVKISDMFLDVGAYSQDEVEEMGISIGDPITLEGWLKELPDGRLAGKSLSSRSGCAVVLQALQKLSGSDTNVSAWLLSQESAFPKDFTPDYTIAVDGTLAGPYPIESVKVEQHEVPVNIGKGPALTLREDDVSIGREIKDLVKKAASKAGVELQIEATSRTGAKRLNPMKQNVSSAILSIPTKYINTPGEVVNFKDLEGAVKVLESFAKLA